MSVGNPVEPPPNYADAPNYGGGLLETVSPGCVEREAG
jgi:hypothetical protein